MVRFYKDKISTKQVSFKDFVDKITANKEIEKTASTDIKPVKTAEADEAETSGQPQAEAKLTNHPEKPEASKGGKADNKPAESSGQLDAKANPNNCPEVKEEAKKVDVKEAAKTEEKKIEKKEEKKVEEKVEEKKADAKPQFVRIAKLTSKERRWLKDYWMNLYPEAYVDAMVSEK